MWPIEFKGGYLKTGYTESQFYFLKTFKIFNWMGLISLILNNHANFVDMRKIYCLDISLLRFIS